MYDDYSPNKNQLFAQSCSVNHTDFYAYIIN